MKNNSSGRVLVLLKVRAILDAFTVAEPELTFGRIRELTGLPPSTCVRLLTNMAELGFLERRGPLYVPGIDLTKWSSVRSVVPTRLVELASPVLDELRDRTDETARLYVRNGLCRVCVAMSETRQSIRRVVSLGDVLPLHAGAAGKVLLAFDGDVDSLVRSVNRPRLTSTTIVEADEFRRELAEVKQAGYATSFGERESQSSSACAPVFDGAGKLVAAIGIGAPLFRMGPSAMASAITPVIMAARELSRRLGYQQDTSSTNMPVALGAASTSRDHVRRPAK